VIRLGIKGKLRRTLESTNPCESMIDTVRTTSTTSSTGPRARWAYARPRPGCSKPSGSSARSSATPSFHSSRSRSNEDSTSTRPSQRPTSRPPSQPLCNYQHPDRRHRTSTATGATSYDRTVFTAFFGFALTAISIRARCGMTDGCPRRRQPQLEGPDSPLMRPRVELVTTALVGFISALALLAPTVDPSGTDRPTTDQRHPTEVSQVKRVEHLPPPASNDHTGSAGTINHITVTGGKTPSNLILTRQVA
jgi:hypothetical protein